MSTNIPAGALPHWDLSVIYPGLDSPAFLSDFHSITTTLDQLTEFFNARGIAKREPAPLDAATVATFEDAINAANALLDQSRTVGAYITGFVTTDSRDNLAQAKMSELQQQSVRLTQLATRLTAWIGSLDVEELIARSEVARAHAFMLRKAQIEATHLMSPAEEELAAELRVTGSTAWVRLHGNYTSQLTVHVQLDGKPQSLPMSMVRNLAYDPRREVRRAAFEAELAAWKEHAVPIAAALNSIKGATNLLSKRRHWDSPLDAAVFDNNIDRATLDAMMTAAQESFSDLRRYLRAKARALGLPALAWYDIFAPLGDGARAWSFDEGAAFIREKFSAYSPKLGALANRAFGEHWIDAEPRVGKRDGAFCMSVRKDESRVLANFKPTFAAVATLAHELGHAYHNVNLAPRTMLQRATPMTLAETASIFCQRLVTNAALQDADAQEQVVILEEQLQDATQVIVDISSRFIFEQRVFEQRQKRELSIDEFNALMLQTQRETYGDGLDPDALHPYMWAVKQHYYQTSFYNYPYMFGLLFGLGLYARFLDDAEKFKAGYDELLSSTGMADAAELASQFGIDTRKPDFWRASLDVIRRDVERFEKLVVEG
ncbi:MAG: M3 family oligoendopeptidase [Chloroflexi bacterium]|nr:M3 family oligoendopeptidase [Chloroflexota bacterium]